MIPDGYPYKVGYTWAPPYRVQRITQVLEKAQSGDKLDVEAMERLQSDVLSLPALQLIARLRTAINLSENPPPAADLLLKWNGEVLRDSAPAALYEVWLRILTGETMRAAIPWPPDQPLRTGLPTK